MALPNPVSEQEPTRPRVRGTLIIFLHGGPAAAAVGTYFGGAATGFRVVYNDLSHYVWWAPTVAQDESPNMHDATITGPTWSTDVPT